MPKNAIKHTLGLAGIARDLTGCDRNQLEVVRVGDKKYGTILDFNPGVIVALSFGNSVAEGTIRVTVKGFNITAPGAAIIAGEGKVKTVR